MSVFQYPRANFRGVFTTNAPTANNDKVSYVNDKEALEIVNPTNQPTDAAYREWMMQTKTVSDVAWLNSYFNYFGDAGTSFDAAASAGMPYTQTVMMSSLLAGGSLHLPADDPFLRGRVELLGHPFFDSPGSAKMVDLDPAGIYGTQIFSGELRVTLTENGSDTVLLSAKNPTRAYIRLMYIDRNISPNPPGAWMGGAIWQAGLPLADLSFDQGMLGQSPTLNALASAAQGGQGLLLRYATYYALDGIPEAALAQQFAEAGYNAAILNPATGMLVGTLAPWSAADDPVSIPLGRWLYPSLGLTRPSSTYAFKVAMRERAPIEAASPAAPPPPYFLAPTPLQVDAANQKIVLDFITTIPEDQGISQPPAANDLHKADYGDLTLTISAQGQEEAIGTLHYADYQRSAYESYGGLVEISYDSRLQPLLDDPSGIFRLYGESVGPGAMLTEVDYPLLVTDDQCLYLQKGETIEYRLTALYKGQALRNTALPLQSSQYYFRTADAGPNNLAIKVFEPLPDPPVISFNSDLQSLSTDANGKVTLSITGAREGLVSLRYQAPGDDFDPNMGQPGKFLYFGFCGYNNFRVFPDDNYDHIPDDQVTWALVYEEVIRYFYLLYPGMFARLGFQDEATARRYASTIRQMVSKRIWDSTSYMPVTRDLSDGKRRLLQRWCALNE